MKPEDKMLQIWHLKKNRANCENNEFVTHCYFGILVETMTPSLLLTNTIQSQQHQRCAEIYVFCASHHFLSHKYQFFNYNVADCRKNHLNFRYDTKIQTHTLTATKRSRHSAQYIDAPIRLIVTSANINCRFAFKHTFYIPQKCHFIVAKISNIFRLQFPYPAKTREK